MQLAIAGEACTREFENAKQRSSSILIPNRTKGGPIIVEQKTVFIIDNRVRIKIRRFLLGKRWAVCITVSLLEPVQKVNEKSCATFEYSQETEPTGKNEVSFRLRMIRWQEPVCAAHK